MKVLTYYDPVMPGQDRILRAWKDSWARRGWEPVVLSEQDARKHPQFAEYWGRMHHYPSVNARKYEDCCWIRWLAYRVHVTRESGLYVATDYDVLNRSFAVPATLTCPPGKLVGLDRCLTPACIVSPKGLDAFILQAMDFAERGLVRYGGRMHVSDMTLAQSLPDIWMPQVVCEEYSMASRSSLVHVSAASILGSEKSKAEVMESLLLI